MEPMLASAILLATVASPRISIPFNDGWQFHRGDILGDAKAIWKRVTLPHDFQIEDLPPKTYPKGQSVVAGQWKFKLGDDPTWSKPTFDDSSWSDVTLPATWAKHLGETPSNRFAWYRRKFKVEIPNGASQVPISVGKIDDCDETFVNGVKVGSTGQMPPNYATEWTVTRIYQVPVSLLKGDGSDVIAVRTYNGSGDAGIYAVGGQSKRSGPFDSEAADGQSTGFTIGGIGWYQTTLEAPNEWKGKRVQLYFDGIYMRAQFYCNGKQIDEHPYGYTAYRVDLSKHLKVGEKNTIAVRVDTTPPNSRWYTGSGIYRQVTLNVFNPTHLDPWNIAVTTPEATAEAATVQIHANPTWTSAADREIQFRITDAAGKQVARMNLANTTNEISTSIRFANPNLWTPETPNLYTLTTVLTEDGVVQDEIKTTFGVRTVEVVPGKGLMLNGKMVNMYGGCNHHDNGPLGACAFPDAEERKVRILKEAGYNAIRTSHNPPSQALLDACDRLGMLVMDEALDSWKQNKGSNYGDYFDKWYMYDISAMVCRDRNHPSVVMWSIGNEIPEQSRPEGAEIGQDLIDAVKMWDNSRPITQAAFPMGEGWAALDPLFNKLDVCGYNYMADVFPGIHAKHPDRLMIQTESQSEHSFSSITQMKDQPYVIGDFIWTAFDYLGEVGVGRIIHPGESDTFFGDFPWTTTGSGEIDIDGVMKPQAYYRKMLFSEKPVVYAFSEPLGPDIPPYKISGWGWRDDHESWTWPGREGKTTRVRVYSNQPQVRLTLNGRDLGVQPTTRATKFTGTYDIPYQPGELVAHALDASGKEVAKWTLQAAGEPYALRLTPESTSLKSGGQGLLYVNVEVVDKNGVRCPNATNMIKFTLKGPATLAAVGNGDAKCLESFQLPQRSAYLGRALAILRSQLQAGEIELVATSNGLKSATLKSNAKN